jgi:S-adenosylmethionine/arginine decarboxylase-like enzyme
MIGSHVILDLHNVSNDKFNEISKNNYKKFINDMSTIITNHNMTIITSSFKNFNSENTEDLKGAFTLLYLLSESHVSFHSWIEHNYIAIDVFTCGNCDTMSLANDIIIYFGTDVKYNIKKIDRGIINF